MEGAWSSGDYYYYYDDYRCRLHVIISPSPNNIHSGKRKEKNEEEKESKVRRKEGEKINFG